MENKIEVILPPSNQNPFVVLKKNRGLASAPLFEGDESALTYACSLFPEIKNVIGKKKIEYGLIHRIDTETQGLLLIATTQESYESIIKAQAEGKFIKGYYAECQKIDQNELIGFPKIDSEILPNNLKNIRISSMFRHYSTNGKQVRPVLETSGPAALKKCSKKLYSTEISIQNLKATCFIKEGFKHQVRCHLAWLGFPIKGDKIYNPNCNENDNFCFFANYLKFQHPFTNQLVEVKLPILM